MLKSEKVFVLDTAVFLNAGTVPDRGLLYTTPDVDLEVKNADSKAIFDNAIQTRGLRIEKSSVQSLKEVDSLRIKIRDTKLSQTDCGVIALAMDLAGKKMNPTVLTDDYSIQNACRHARIMCEGVIMGTIKRKKQFAKKNGKNNG